MSTTAVTMTPAEALEFRAAHDAEALRLSRMTTAELKRETGHGTRLLGRHSRDELIAAALDQGGYTITRLNLAVCSLYHDVVWDGCPSCARRAS